MCVSLSGLVTPTYALKTAAAETELPPPSSLSLTLPASQPCRAPSSTSLLLSAWLATLSLCLSPSLSLLLLALLTLLLPPHFFPLAFFKTFFSPPLSLSLSVSVSLILASSIRLAGYPFSLCPSLSPTFILLLPCFFDILSLPPPLSLCVSLPLIPSLLHILTPRSFPYVSFPLFSFLLFSFSFSPYCLLFHFSISPYYFPNPSLLSSLFFYLFNKHSLSLFL